MTEPEIGLDISWKHTKNRRQIKIEHGDARLSISHAQTEKGGFDLSILVQTLPAVLEQIALAIEQKEAAEHGIEH